MPVKKIPGKNKGSSGPKLPLANVSVKKRLSRPYKEKLTKIKLLRELSIETGLSSSDVSKVLLSLTSIARRSLMPGGCGEFTLSTFLKILVKEMPARDAYIGRNPSTGESISVAAKGKARVIKIKPLKKLTDVI